MRITGEKQFQWRFKVGMFAHFDDDTDELVILGTDSKLEFCYIIGLV